MTFAIEKEQLTALAGDGRSMGFISFPRLRGRLVNISQVTVHPAFRSQGVEAAMLEALLTHLSENNQKAALTSPHAQQYVSKNPQWKHLLPGELHFTSH